ncbi:MAG: response regulator, partial [Treponema sp.]|nr:response regulator [Treponema sp.]
MYRLILVDDEPWALSGLEEIIDWTAEGFEICGRCTGAMEALEIMKRCDADVIFTDIRMPRMNGLELISAVKQQKPDAECVIISAYSDFEVARKAIWYQTAGYILKPLERSEVLEMARRIKGQLDAKNTGSHYLNIEDLGTLEHAIQWLDQNSRASRCCIVISRRPIKNKGQDIWEIGILGYPLYVYFCSSNEKTLPFQCRNDGSMARSRWHENRRDLSVMFKEAEAAGNGRFSYAEHFLVADIQFYIGVNFAKNISLKSIAKDFLLSESYLCELFKKHSGETIIKFLNRVRLHNARRLLEHSDLSIKDVYQQTGFSDYSYFDRSFKRIFGINPEALRSQAQGKNRGKGCVNFDLPRNEFWPGARAPRRGRGR